MKRTVQLSLLFAGILLVCAAFTVKVGSGSEAPGTLTAIGDAGSPNVFTFNRWSVQKESFDPNSPADMKLIIEIDMTSATTDWKDLEKSILKKKDYFYIEKFPKAYVTINGASKIEGNTFTTDAELEIKGKTGTVPLTFSVEGSGPYHIVGQGEMDRTKFKFKGKGPKDMVPIAFDFMLE
ncbi:MAG: YceI family protein [Bacteroidota bacterium]